MFNTNHKLCDKNINNDNNYLINNNYCNLILLCTCTLSNESNLRNLANCTLV